jgi:hypothetical protein
MVSAPGEEHARACGSASSAGGQSLGALHTHQAYPIPRGELRRGGESIAEDSSEEKAGGDGGEGEGDEDGDSEGDADGEGDADADGDGVADGDGDGDGDGADGADDGGADDGDGEGEGDRAGLPDATVQKNLTEPGTPDGYAAVRVTGYAPDAADAMVPVMSPLPLIARPGGRPDAVNCGCWPAALSELTCNRITVPGASCWLPGSTRRTAARRNVSGAVG